MKKKSWTKQQLKLAVRESSSVRQVIKKLKLKPAGGNYVQIKKFFKIYNVSIEHFKGSGWRKGIKGFGIPRIPLEKILVRESNFQSFKLKNRLFDTKIKLPRCEDCGWAQKSSDGRLPLELDHINGDSHDNRLDNLRVLCPNCHSLKPTHRGRNRKKKFK